VRITQYGGTSATHTTRPPVVYGIAICIGGGGHGGGVTGNGSSAGGGAGGQYCKGTLTLTGSTGYAVVGGAAKSTSTTAQVDGNDSTFASTTVVAKGGTGAVAVAASGSTGAGGSGSLTGAVGNLITAAGGNGAAATAVNASGAGGGAGGGNATAQTGGTSPYSPLGSDGAAGRTTGGGGNAANNYGGGGGGAYANNNTDRLSGAGGTGICEVWELDQNDLMLLGCG
jgi:hypothetical protein